MPTHILKARLLLTTTSFPSSPSPSSNPESLLSVVNSLEEQDSYQSSVTMPLLQRATLFLSVLLSLSLVHTAPTPQNILLAQKYAPQFRFHKDEVYFPSTIEFFLAAPVSLYDANGPLAGAPSPLTTSNLASTANQGSGTYITTNINANLNGFLRGQNPSNSQPTTYTFIAPKANGVVDLFYWIFTPYNLGKKITLLGYVGDHVGDWERITVRTVNGVATSVDYHAHGDAGSGTIPYAQAPKFSPSNPNAPPTANNPDPNARPVAYVAKGSHGMWSTPGTFTYVNAVIFKLQDQTSDGGVYWDTQNHLTTINYPDTYTGEMGWLNYQGDWGNKAVNNCWWYAIHKECELVDGPNGPARADTLGQAKRRKRQADDVPLVDNLDAPLSHALATEALGSSSYTFYLDAAGAQSIAVEQVCASKTTRTNSTSTGEEAATTYTTSNTQVPTKGSGTKQYKATMAPCASEGSFVESYAVGLCTTSSSSSSCAYGARRNVRVFSTDPNVVGPQEMAAVTLHDLDNWVF